ncbi:vitelline membrane outer layer protein 1-like [Eublepharis macularius]|uniref:Vitelline membrane outer layer protein 1-like n=1 Tax=Eublepharis macularius TaxID=481883 RepID=A0AA97J3L4_EUBMA|nr:vitelline membrane outer layer protein 1-like [Eublepharis macularius]
MQKLILRVPNGARWGKWRDFQFCYKSYAKGFSLKVQPYQGFFFDDTSLNGIRLHCSDGSMITSTVGPDGTWSKAKTCKKSGHLTSFSLRVQATAPFENTAANNIKFKCTDGSELEGDGHAWGKYGPWSQSCKKGGICGIQTKVDVRMWYENPPYRRRSFLRDLTGLNDVKFVCCN